jgi:Spy/CpxP family protein refolding chaperone
MQRRILAAMVLMAVTSLTACAGTGAQPLATTLPGSEASSSFVVAQDPSSLPPFLDDLNLTPEQEAQLQDLRESRRSQFEAILTPEQQQILTELEAQEPEEGEGQGRRGRRRRIREALNLTEDQVAQLQTIREESRSEFEAILTPEQLTQLEEKQANRPGRGPRPQ